MIICIILSSASNALDNEASTGLRRRLRDGSKCNSDSNCVSNHCINQSFSPCDSTCGLSPLGSPCDEDSDCQDSDNTYYEGGSLESCGKCVNKSIEGSKYRRKKAAIRSAAFSTYIRAWPGGLGLKVDMSTKTKDWERFKLMEVRPGFFVIKSIHNTYIRAWPGGLGSKVDLSTTIKKWELFELEKVSPGVYAIKSVHGTYIRALPGGLGLKVDLSTTIKEWEKFMLVEVY